MVPRPFREAAVSLASGLGTTALISAGLCAACSVTGIDIKVLALAAVVGSGLSVAVFIIFPEWLASRTPAPEPDTTEHRVGDVR